MLKNPNNNTIENQKIFEKIEKVCKPYKEKL